MSIQHDADDRIVGEQAPPPPDAVADGDRLVQESPGPDETVPDADRSDGAGSTSDPGGDSDPGESAGADPDAPGQR